MGPFVRIPLARNFKKACAEQVGHGDPGHDLAVEDEVGVLALAEHRRRGRVAPVHFEPAIGHVHEPVDRNSSTEVCVGHGPILGQARIRHLDDQRDVGRTGVEILVIVGDAPGDEHIRLAQGVTGREADRLLELQVPARGQQPLDGMTAFPDTPSSARRPLVIFSHQIPLDQVEPISLR